MTTWQLHDHLKGLGCKFLRRGKHRWVCFLDKEKVSSSRYLGELVREVAKALGEV